MARFDKYLKETKEKEIQKEKQKVEERRFSNLSLPDRMSEASLFFKYSALFGKYFFFIKPIKTLSISISRKIFGTLPNYKKDSEEEIKIAAGLTGILYISIILFLLVFDSKSPMGGVIMLLIGIFATISNLNIIRRYLTLGEIGTIPITSDEVLSFLSWLILLMESGLNLFGAFDYYVSKEKNNLSLLFDSALKEVKTSELSLDKALGNLAIEVQRNDLKEILTLILQSEQQGVSIKDTLYNYFERYQADIQSIAEKKGSSANQKATFMLTGEVFLLMMYFMLAMLASLSNL